MNLKHRFRYIDANGRDLFHSNAPGLSILTDAILAPGEREPSIPSISNCYCSGPCRGGCRLWVVGEACNLPFNSGINEVQTPHPKMLPKVKCE